MAASVKTSNTETVASLNACSVFRIATATTEITTIAAIRVAGAIIQGISFAKIIINFIMVSWTLSFACHQRSHTRAIFQHDLYGNDHRLAWF